MQVIDPTVDSGKIFALGYGGSGTGKTHFAGTLGDLGYTLLIDADKGYKTLTKKNVPGITQKMRDNLVIVSFDQFADLDTAYKLVDANDPYAWNKELNSYWVTDKNGRKKRVTKPENEWVQYVIKPLDWVVWDTWSEIQWSMKQKLRVDKKLNVTVSGATLDFRPNFEIQHWGMLTDLNTLSIETLRDVTYAGGPNQLFLMQEKVDKNETLGTVEKGPSIHGKLVTEVPTYFDVVFHATTDPMGIYKATTKRQGGWPAKTRMGAGQEYKNPTAKELFGL